jgi:hypothetical protein
MPVSPSAVTPTVHAASYTFPITKGTLDAATQHGTIYHSGGLLLARYTTPTTMPTSWQTLSLTRFIIHLGSHAYVTAIVNGGVRETIATLDLSKDHVTYIFAKHQHYVLISGITVALSATAISAINAEFGTSLTAPVTLGGAWIEVRVVS